MKTEPLTAAKKCARPQCNRPAVPTERFCHKCRLFRVSEMHRTGYLKPAPAQRLGEGNA